MVTKWDSSGLRTICVDFNGVLDTYAGFVPGYMYPPRPGVDKFLAELSRDYDVIILTASNALDVYLWLERHNLKQYVKRVTREKVPAIAYIDDRAITFNGNFNTVLDTLRNFRCFWEDDEHIETPRKDNQ